MREGVNGLLSYKTRKPRKSPLLSGCGKSSGQIGADLKVYAVSVSYTHLTLPTNREV